MDVAEVAQTDVVGTAPYRFRRFIDRAVIRDVVRQMATTLRTEYRDKDPILIGVLNGCFIFMADLVREMNIPCEVDFVKVSSYADSMTSGAVKLIKDVDADIEGRHILLIEDIVDTGKSLGFLRQHLMAKKPASLAMAAMFVKDCPKAEGAEAEYAGIHIPPDFVVGYGLDYAQQWRQLPDLHTLIENEQ